MFVISGDQFHLSIVIKSLHFRAPFFCPVTGHDPPFKCCVGPF